MRLCPDSSLLRLIPCGVVQFFSGRPDPVQVSAPRVDLFAWTPPLVSGHAPAVSLSAALNRGPSPAAGLLRRLVPPCEAPPRTHAAHRSGQRQHGTPLARLDRAPRLASVLRAKPRCHSPRLIASMPMHPQSCYSFPPPTGQHKSSPARLQPSTSRPAVQQLARTSTSSIQQHQTMVWSPECHRLQDQPTIKPVAVDGVVSTRSPGFPYFDLDGYFRYFPDNRNLPLRTKPASLLSEYDVELMRETTRYSVVLRHAFQV